MIDDQSTTKRVLRRIAEALGTDVDTFSAGHAEARTLHQPVELLSAFERVTDPNDRRACIDYVHALAARGQART